VTQRFISTPFKAQRHGGYSVPVPDDALARCWGRARDPDFKAFDLERTNCQQDSQLFAGDITTGFIRVRYEAYDAPKFSALRFASMYSDSMGNEQFALRGRTARPPPSARAFRDRAGMAMRYLRAPTAKFHQHNVSVLVGSLFATQNASGWTYGVSFEMRWRWWPNTSTAQMEGAR
jgi:hypothetical protein